MAGQYNAMDVVRCVLSACHAAGVRDLPALDPESFAAVLSAQHGKGWLEGDLKITSLERFNQLAQVELLISGHTNMSSVLLTLNSYSCQVSFLVVHEWGL